MGEKVVPNASPDPLPGKSSATGKAEKPKKAESSRLLSRFVDPKRQASAPSKGHGGGLRFEELFGDLGDLNGQGESASAVVLSAPLILPSKTPPPVPRDALDGIMDDELASFESELRDLVREIDETSVGAKVEDVIRSGNERFATPKEVAIALADGEIGEMRRAAEAKATAEAKKEAPNAEAIEKKVALEGAIAIVHREAEDRKSRKDSQKEIMDSITEMLVEGEGAQVGTLSVFDEKVGEEDQWGLRRVRFGGKYNFIDRENRILCPRKKADWFDEVSDFMLKGGGSGFPSTAAVALAKSGQVNFFLGLDGELVPASLQGLQSFLLGQGKERSGSRWEQGMVNYWERFEQKLNSISRRYTDDPKVKESYGQLTSALVAIKGTCLSKAWGPMLTLLKGVIEASDLSGGHKAHLEWVLRTLALDAKIDPGLVSAQFPIPEVETGTTMIETGQYDNGLILRVERKGRVVFNLMNTEGKWLYSLDSAFDSIGRFTDKVALVRRGKEFNFLNRENGNLVVPDTWYGDVGEPHADLYRVCLGKTFNYMRSNGQWLSSVPFDEADEFDEKGRARVRSGKREFVINAKGEPVMSFDAKRFVENLFRIHSDGQLMQEKKKETLLAAASEAKEFFQQPNLGDALHRIFNAMLAEFPEESGAIVALFGHFRKILNAMVEAFGKRQGESRSVHSQKAYGEIERALVHSEVPAEAKTQLRQFSLKMKDLRWRRIDPLPISLMSSFSALLRRHPEEESAMIPMLREMESLTNRYQNWSKGNLLRLQPDFEVLLARARLSPSAHRQVRGMFLSMMGNSNSYWCRGSSVDEWGFDSQGEGGKGSAQASRSMVRHEVSNPIPALHWANFCDEISRGDLTLIEKNIGLLAGLERGNPGYAFNHGKMGLALFGAIQRLQKDEPEALPRLLEPTIHSLRKAEGAGDRKVQVHFVLGQLREYRARSGEGLAFRIPFGRRYTELGQAVDSYEKAMESSPNEKLKSQIELRHREARNVLRFRGRVRLALLLALLASAEALNYQVGSDFHLSDLVGGLKRELLVKPFGSKVEPGKGMPEKASAAKKGGTPPPSAKKQASERLDEKRKMQLRKAFSDVSRKEVPEEVKTEGSEEDKEDPSTK